jgi:hypothetical protein
MTEQKKNILRSLLLMQLQGGSITRAEYNEKIAAIPPAADAANVQPPCMAAQEIAKSMAAYEISKSTLAQESNPQIIANTQTPPLGAGGLQQTPPLGAGGLHDRLSAIDKEKSRLCNMLHTIPPNKSAKHITDQILALRLKRKEAYTTGRISDAAANAAAVQPPCMEAHGSMPAPPSEAGGATLLRQSENLRIKIGRWEKKLAADPDNFELKQKLADAKADYQSLRA